MGMIGPPGLIGAIGSVGITIARITDSSESTTRVLAIISEQGVKNKMGQKMMIHQNWLLIYAGSLFHQVLQKLEFTALLTR